MRYKGGSINQSQRPWLPLRSWSWENIQVNSVDQHLDLWGSMAAPFSLPHKFSYDLADDYTLALPIYPFFANEKSLGCPPHQPSYRIDLWQEIQLWLSGMYCEPSSQSLYLRENPWTICEDLIILQIKDVIRDTMHRYHAGHHSGHFGVRSRVKSIVNPHCWFRRHDSSDDELAHQITPIEEGPLSESNGQSMSNNDQSPASYNRERPEQQIMESHVREGVNNLDLRSGDRVSENGVREDQNDVHDLEVPYFSPFTRLIDHHRTASWILERERNPTESAQLRENARNEEEELKLAVVRFYSPDFLKS